MTARVIPIIKRLPGPSRRQSAIVLVALSVFAWVTVTLAFWKAIELVNLWWEMGR